MSENKSKRAEISRKRVLSNSASSGVLLVANLAVSLWVQQRLIRNISEEEYALLPVIASLLAFTPLLQQVLSGGLGFFMTKAHATGDDEEVCRITSTILPLMLCVSALIASVGSVAGIYLDSILNIAPDYLPTAKLMFFLFIGSTALHFPMSIFGSGLMVTQRMTLQDGISAIGQALRMGLLLFFLTMVSTSVLWVVVSTVISDFVVGVLLTGASLHYVPAQIPKVKAFTGRLIKELLNFGSWSVLEQLARSLRLSMDPLILNRFSTAGEVTTFQAGSIIPRQLEVLTVPLLRPLIPVFATLHAVGDVERMGRIYLRIARYATCLFLAITIPAITFAHDLLLIYLDGRYPKSGNIAVILVLVPTLMMFNALGAIAVLASGKVRQFSIRQIIVQCVNVAVTLLLVIWFRLGAVGCALASVTAVLIAEVPLIWRFCRRTVNVSLSRWWKAVVVPHLLPVALVSALAVAVKHTVTPSLLVILSAGFGLFATYFFVFVRIGTVDEDITELRGLAERFPRPIKAVLILLLPKARAKVK